ncbi:hypothetical protein HFP65_25945 [Bacillus sp. CB62A.1]
MKRVAWITDSTTANFKTEGDNFVIQSKLLLMEFRTKIVKKVYVNGFIMR